MADRHYEATARENPQGIAAHCVINSTISMILQLQTFAHKAVYDVNASDHRKAKTHGFKAN